MSKLKKFIKKNWLILLILLLAATLRLYKINDYAEFLGDQGRDVLIVRDFLKNGNLFFIGPQTSIGNMYLGPFYYYLIAPSLLLANFNPLGPAIFIALISVLTVWFIYFVGKKWFNPTTALIASFLYAISPVAIKYGTFSWNPNIMPFFSLLFIYWVAEKKYPLAALAFAMCLNSHYLALILLPVAGFIWLKNYQPKLLKPTFIAIFIFLLTLAPQILFDIKHQGQNFNSLKTFFTQRETTVNLKAYKSIPLIPKLFNQINTSLLAAHQSQISLYVSLFLFMGIIALIIKNKFKNKYFLYSVLWYLFALIGLGLYKQHIYDHYFAFVFPVVYLLFGYLLSQTPLLVTLPTLLLLSYFSIVNLPFKYPGNRQLANTKAIVDTISRLSENKEFNFTLLAKTNYDPAYVYFIKEANLAYYPLQDKITEQLFVVCEPHPDINCQPINHPEWGIAAFGWAKIDQELDQNGVKVYRLLPNPDGKQL